MRRRLKKASIFLLAPVLILSVMLSPALASEGQVGIVWEQSETFTVTFNGNGGTVEGASAVTRQTSPGTSLGTLLPGNTVHGYMIFRQWNTAPDGSGAVFLSTTPVTGHIHVYAQWGYEIRFVNSDSSPIFRYVVSPGSDATDVPASPARPGYAFTGWSPAPPFINVQEHITSMAQYRFTGGGGNGGGGGGGGAGAGGGGAVPPAVVELEEQIPLAQFISDHIAYITGYPDGTVRPNNPITRAEVAAIFFRLLDIQGTPEAGNRFSDVSSQSWYTQAVSYLASTGVLTGYPDGTFRPNQSITRAEFAAVASRFDELGRSAAVPFSDVGANHWAYGYIISAFAKGWAGGYPDGTFRPSNSITRAEVVTIVNRMLDRNLLIEDVPPELVNMYIDLQTNHWAFADIIEASVTHEFERREDGTEIWTSW